MKLQVHKITILVEDFDNLGAEGVWEVLEDTRFANDCIGPRVMDVHTVEIDWTDDHPLNKYDTRRKEYERLFPEGK